MPTLHLAVQAAFHDFVLDLQERWPLEGITALFGPSGSGKSTLLRVIAGLEPRARGRVALDDETWLAEAPVRAVPAYRRGVGLVFQEAGLFPHLSVEGNLHYAERRSRHSRATPVNFGEVVRALDLAPLLHRKPASLSGGERQRVAIGRTLLARPRLLLMDEPLAALDARRKSEILPYIEQLPHAFGVPVIYVTHDIDEVTRLADRLVLLAHGRVVAAGPLQELLERLDLQPATGRFEAGVVLETRVEGHDERFRLTQVRHGSQTLSVPMTDVPVGTVVRLRIRARDVALAIEPPRGLSIRNVLAGTLAALHEEPDTPFAETLVDIGGARIRARLTRQAVAELGLQVGQPVYALVKSIALDRRVVARA
ncbi:MAG TPA: molybdenum ABC transporter ATP-binding protein [Burkholderiaceae bacterium]|nr:molybdenum ABC transporter ATP-binding protein [Burkholderiaceae bacterium]